MFYFLEGALQRESNGMAYNSRSFCFHRCSTSKQRRPTHVVLYYKSSKSGVSMKPMVLEISKYKREDDEKWRLSSVYTNYVIYFVE